VEVTGQGKFHFEFANRFDVLNAAAFPALKQNTSDFTLDYGLARNMEISVESPLITVIVDGLNRSRYIGGIGDTNIAVKYNFYRERKGSRLPSLSASFNLEFPTGNVSRGLGSGLEDYFVNVIAQKSLTSRTTWRVNGGILFAGNTATGAIGIRRRGEVYTAGTSVVRQVNERLDLGGEIVGAVSPDFSLIHGLLQVKAGGNYLLSKKLSLDFAVITGHFVASPRFGAQLGFSYDF
jgi:Putative MetA-pathway of phenol degradation